VSTALEEARRLHKEGFVDLTPVKERTKRATLTGWQNTVIPLDEYPRHFPVGKSIGVKTSATLRDVDLDCPEAREVEDNQRFSEATVKSLTGQDLVSARLMRGEYFTHRPSYKFYIATNHRPGIRGTDHAIWERIRLIPFAVTIPQEKRDKHLREKLMTESEGILNWIVEGAKAWYRDGLQAPALVTEATQEYRDEMDVLKDFLDACCVLGPKCATTSTQLYSAYREWAEAAGEYIWTQRHLGMKLRERGFEQGRATGGTRLWIGVGLRAES
jgi:putative DNA primase/helicase